MAQTWNNLLNYIKRNTGSTLNLLELSDDEIIEGIKEDVIPEYSQYDPHKRAIYLTPENRVSIERTGTRGTYRLPVPDDTYIIRIFDAYSSPTSHATADPFYGTKYSQTHIRGSLMHYGYGSVGVVGGGLIDAAVDNTFLDILDYFSVKQTWEFRPPDIIVFDQEIYDAVVIYCTVHETLDTISPDLYHFIFRKMALYHVLSWIYNIRSKYESIATPMGEIRVNYQQIEQQMEKLEQQLEEQKRNIPQDHFVEIF